MIFIIKSCSSKDYHYQRIFCEILFWCLENNCRYWCDLVSYSLDKEDWSHFLFSRSRYRDYLYLYFLRILFVRHEDIPEDMLCFDSDYVKRLFFLE